MIMDLPKKLSNFAMVAQFHDFFSLTCREIILPLDFIVMNNNKKKEFRLPFRVIENKNI